MVKEAQELAEKNPEAILIIAADGTLLYANSSADFILTHWRCSAGDPVPAEWRSDVSKVLLTGGPLQLCGRIAHRFLRYTLVPVPPDQVNVYVRDTTEWVRTEEALRFRLNLEDEITRISAEFINLMPDDMDAGIVRTLGRLCGLACVDRAYVFLYSLDDHVMSNTHEYCMPGIPPHKRRLQNVPANAFPWFSGQMDHHQAVVIDSVNDLGLNAAAEKREFEYENIRSLLCVPMVCNGRLMGFIGFDRVLSEAPWTEEIITLVKFVGPIFANALDRKNAEQERERLLRTLASKNEELQSIVYIASHDLKTPLVNIQGFADQLASACEQFCALLGETSIPDSLRTRFDSVLTDDIPESLHFIRAGAAKMQSLLDGLLDVARAGTATVKIRPLDMNDLMGRIIAAMQYQITAAGASVAVDPLPDCLGDSDRLNQVFTNILCNAVKYLQPGRPGRIIVTGRLEDSHAVYCVRDNGRGIAPQHSSKVFEIFHRLDPNDSAGGEGLGLTIARRIVERHNGRIWLESEPEKGSRFFVALPAAPQ